jgi:hypothetical protein
MSSASKGQLLTILKGLREYISNEYTLNADGSKGGDSTMSVDKDLDADWVNKLDPLSGGQGGEREGALGKTTSAAKQGTNPYLHKNVEDENFLENLEDNEEEDDEEDLEENIEENEEDEEADEIIDEELGGMYGKSADGAILNLLKDVKGLLESRHMEKAAMSDIREELDDIRKAMPTSVEAGIKSGMKGFGFTPTAGEMKRVKPKSKRNNRVSGHQIQKSATSAPSAPIGVEGDSLADIGAAGDSMSAGEVQQGQFVDAVETILKTNDTDDLRGTFKKVNSMRDQQGDVAPSTLYYHKAGGN